MKILFFIVLLLAIANSSYSENLDSLKIALKTAKDTAKVNTLNRICRALADGELEEFYQYALESKALSETIHYDKGLANALQNIGTYFVETGNEKQGIMYYKKALPLCPDNAKVQASLLYNIGRAEYHFSNRIYYLSKALSVAEKGGYKKIIPTLYSTMGNSYYNIADYKRAYEYYIKGLKIAEDNLDSSAMVWNLTGMARILEMQKEKESLGVYKKALAIGEKLNNKFFLCTFKNALSSYYLFHNRPDTALIIAHQALQLAKEINDVSVMKVSYNELGYAHQLLNKYDTAIKYYNLALKNTSNYEEDPYKATILGHLGSAYIAKKHYQKAVGILQEAMAIGKKRLSNEALTSIYLNLSVAYEKQNNYKDSHHYFKLYHHLKDSLFNLEKSKEITSMSNKYELEKKEQSIKILKQSNDIKDLKIAKSNVQLMAMVVLCLFILFISILFYSRYRIKKKANISMKKANDEILSMMREKEVLIQEIHHRVKNNLQLVSSLLKWHSEDVVDDQMLKVISEGQSRIKSMAMIHEALYQSENLGDLDLNGYLGNLLNYLQEINSKDKAIYITKHIQNISLNVELAIPLGLIVTEVVSNAFKYAFPAGQGVIDIVLEKQETERYCLKIKDNGIGFSEDLLKKKKENSMGLQLVKILVKQIKGQLEITNQDGACFTITFAKTRGKKSAFGTNKVETSASF